ncbi:AAA family ATPase, partial [Mycobacterium tuberculosis]|nr:AAA family ATPase [Mycobacterium tuberculosis]
AGDRNALALAFFFASLDQDPQLAQKVVVIDDPMTSLDEHRSLTTVQEIRRLVGRVAQVIVLSHSKPFLCGLWEGANPADRSAIRVS